MFRKTTCLFATALVALTNSFGSPARADQPWEFTLSPLYLWATGIEGESQIGPITAPVSIEFSDAFDNLETIFTFHFEANRGNHGVLANLMHINLTPESSLPNGAPAAVDLTNDVLDLAGIYRPNGSETWEVLYGLRWSNFELSTRTISSSACPMSFCSAWIRSGSASMRPIGPTP